MPTAESFGCSPVRVPIDLWTPNSTSRASVGKTEICWVPYTIIEFLGSYLGHMPQQAA